MTPLSDPSGARGVAVDTELEVISGKFAGVRKILKRQIESVDPKVLHTSRPRFERVRDLLRAQLLVMQAEKALYDKLSQIDDCAGPDVEAIRDQIGRKLDRIRDAALAADVSGRIEPE